MRVSQCLTREVNRECVAMCNTREERQSAVDKTIASYDRVAFGYAQHYYSRDLMVEFRDDFCQHIPNGGLVLDAGCGPGHDSKLLVGKGYGVVGVDLSSGMVEEARRRVPEAAFVRADIRWDVKSLGRRFDGIWCCASLLHIPRDDAASTLRGLWGVANAGAPLFVSVMKGSGDVFRTEDRPFGRVDRYFVWYSCEHLKRLISSAGFDVEWAKISGRWISALSIRRGKG